jgi:spermidine synthase
MFQTIDVFDVSLVDRPFEDYQKSLSNDKTSYHAQHPELFAPDRIVFMGGLLQSRRLGDASYHEALVHPGLFAHKSPKRVAIIGGGEGATLREILKHDTIEQVVMIDIDKMIVEISKEYLPQWSDCSNLVGRSDSCFEDAKAEVYLEDAFKWFKDRFLEDGELVGSEDPFDVIIMDALDPQGLTEFVANLYTDKFFYESLYRGLADDGILVAQLGASRSLNDPPEDHR